MTNKTLDQLSAVTPPLVSTDLFAVLRNASGVLTSVAWSVIQSTLQTAFSSVFLQLGNNLSDLASASTARTNLGLGPGATAAWEPVKTVSGKLVDSNNDVDVPFFRNRLINGDMRIDQRRAGASVTAGVGNTYVIDRWAVSSPQISKLTVGQNQNALTPLPDYPKYLGLIVASGVAVVGATEFYGIYQAIEGVNVQDLDWGTANAKSVTLSFWVQANQSGTFGGAVKNASTRSYPFIFTISNPNVWEYKTVTIPGDQSGSWPIDNSASIYVAFAAGYGVSSSGAPGSWQAGSLFSGNTATLFIHSTGNTFNVTAVQLEAGSVSTFERRPYAIEMQLCQRYYENNMPSGSAPADGTPVEAFPAAAWAANSLVVDVPFKVEKRATPSTFAFYRTTDTASNGQWGVLTGGAWVAGTGTAATRQTTKSFCVAVTTTIANGSAVICGGGWQADAEL